MTRSKHSCLNFEDSGEVFPIILTPICKNCRWSETTHHIWERKPGPNLDLGPGWYCKRCGRTAYDQHGECNEKSPPIYYPSCGNWSSNS